VKEGFARLAGELGNDQIVGGAKKRREFRGGKGVAGFQGDPLGTREVWGGDDTRTLREFREVFWRHLKGEPDAGGFQRRNGKHFAGDLEEEVVTPLDLLGGRREGEAEFAELIDVHGGNLLE
jgi:hypothetical protein